MPKNILQDITPPKKSIRDIPMPSRHRPTNQLRKNSDVQEVPRMPRQRRQPPRFIIWGIAGISVVFLTFVILSLFSGATVYITPKTQQVTIDAGKTFVANNDSTGAPFDVVSVSKIDTIEVEASSSKEVSAKASGIIIVYNTNTSAQRLIANTRFSTANGNIYRINSAVTVPAGTATKPGSLEVTVYADVAGDSYNIDKADFTVPGLKGSDLYDKVYARTKTAITGGFVGKEYVIDQAQKDSSYATLDKQLQGELPQSLTAQIPDSYTVPADGTFMSFETLQTEDKGGGKVSLRRQGTLTAIIFSKEDFAQYLAKAIIGDPKGTVHIADMSKMSVAILSKLTAIPTKNDAYNLSISGDVTFEWVIDTKTLQEDLSEKPKSTLQEVLTTMSAIDKARAVIRPFWKGMFPKSTNIKIVIEKTGQ